MGESDLVTLRRLADELAEKRKERATTGHLLAAIAAKPGPASDLLSERRLDFDVLLKAARVHTDDARDAVSRVMQRARDLASRGSNREVTALHLLFALCHERTTAAYRALEQCGSDVAKLRTAALQVATGMAPPRRIARVEALAPSLRIAQTSPFRPASPTLPPPSLRPSIMTPPAVRPPLHVPVTVTTAAPKPKRPKPAPLLAREPKKHAAHEAPKKEPNRFALDEKRFPLLARVGKNLTLAASRGELDPVVGRHEEIEKILDVLARRSANNACVVGPAGVGKTTVVRGVALRAASREVLSLDENIIVEIEVSSLISGTGARGALAEKIIELKAEASDP
ncbi:MAG: AAA family ATPase, partial [Polyangiaceae bacterium]